MKKTTINVLNGKIKNIAFYLPQFYQFPENDKWWGEGFTEWTNVKKSQPLYKNHYQPTVPLNNNFYSLNDINTLFWQVDLAKKYGIDGFCFYHYWFGEDRQLMEKPVDNYLKTKKLDLPFCLCWANHNWTRTWVGGDKEILMDMRYGDKNEWQKHFDYLFPFFDDDRYIRIDDKPVLVIYMPQDIPCLDEMLRFFDKLANNSGLKGITFIAQNCIDNRDKLSCIDYFINYEPNRSLKTYHDGLKKAFTSLNHFYNLFIYDLKRITKKISKGKLCRLITYNYDALWKLSLKTQLKKENEIAGAFVKCDVSPRRQERAVIVKGSTPTKFKKYMKLLYNKISKKNVLPYVFISAWNEWGEGMYLEPDEKNKYEYLEAIKELKDETI